jgi:hypothetical protein
MAFKVLLRWTPAALVVITFNMPEDMSFGDWRDVTPEAMRTYSEEKLHLAMCLNRGGGYDEWARAELQRRRDETLGELLRVLTGATHEVRSAVETLASTSRKLEGLTSELVGETGKVHTEVGLLADSSTRMETLTVALKRFTICLLVFAGLQIAIAGIQTWKMFQPEGSSHMLPAATSGTAPRVPGPQQ